MLAIGVPYAAQLNQAWEEYGVPPTLLQAMRDIDGVVLFDLPDSARAFAMNLSNRLGTANARTEEGAKDPATNFRALAWWLVHVADMNQNGWAAVAEFYGGGPQGRAKAFKVQSGPYVRRKREWGG